MSEIARKPGISQHVSVRIAAEVVARSQSQTFLASAIPPTHRATSASARSCGRGSPTAHWHVWYWSEEDMHRRLALIGCAACDRWCWKSRRWPHQALPIEHFRPASEL